jgi:AcrR family transcriptional regulator
LLEKPNAIRILFRVPDPTPRALQDRSRRTAERILTAALELLAERSFEQMAVSEIAAKAGISVGGFYARFAGKEALLESLHVGLFEGLVAQARERLSPQGGARAGAREVVRRYLGFAVASFRRHRAVLRQVALRSRSSRDPAFRERVRAMNRLLHDLLRARLEERLAECAHPEPRLAIDVALNAVSGAMREHVLFQEPADGFTPLDDERLVTELTDLFTAYLRVRDDD